MLLLNHSLFFPFSLSHIHTSSFRHYIDQKWSYPHCSITQGISGSFHIHNWCYILGNVTLITEPNKNRNTCVYYVYWCIESLVLRRTYRITASVLMANRLQWVDGCTSFPTLDAVLSIAFIHLRGNNLHLTCRSLSRFSWQFRSRFWQYTSAHYPCYSHSMWTCNSCHTSSLILTWKCDAIQWPLIFDSLIRSLCHCVLPASEPEDCDCSEHTQSHLGPDPHLLWSGNIWRPSSDWEEPSAHCGGAVRSRHLCEFSLFWYVLFYKQVCFMSNLPCISRLLTSYMKPGLIYNLFRLRNANFVR